MEKRKHRSGTKQVKQKGETKVDTRRVDAPPTQPEEHHSQHSGGGLTEALRHQDELVEEKSDDKS